MRPKGTSTAATHTKNGSNIKSIFRLVGEVKRHRLIVSALRYLWGEYTNTIYFDGSGEKVI